MPLLQHVSTRVTWPFLSCDLNIHKSCLFCALPCETSYSRWSILEAHDILHNWFAHFLPLFHSHVQSAPGNTIWDSPHGKSVQYSFGELFHRNYIGANGGLKLVILAGNAWLLCLNIIYSCLFKVLTVFLNKDHNDGAALPCFGLVFQLWRGHLNVLGVVFAISGNTRCLMSYPMVSEDQGVLWNIITCFSKSLEK